MTPKPIVIHDISLCLRGEKHFTEEGVSTPWCQMNFWSVWRLVSSPGLCISSFGTSEVARTVLWLEDGCLVGRVWGGGQPLQSPIAWNLVVKGRKDRRSLNDYKLFLLVGWLVGLGVVVQKSMCKFPVRKERWSQECGVASGALVQGSCLLMSNNTVWETGWWICRFI